MTDANANLPARHANGQFGPGNPGRPVGSYNRASKRAALAVLEHFENNRDHLLDGLISNPDSRALYIKLLARVLPRELEVTVFEPAPRSDREVAIAYSQARVLLDGNGDRREALADLEGLLLNARPNADEPAHR